MATDATTTQTMQKPPAGTPCWIDLLTTDAERARRFYRAVFGWSPTEPAPEFGGYFQFLREGRPVAGCMPLQPGAGPADEADVWGVYLAVDDAAAAAGAVPASGGRVRQPAFDVADLGRSALFTDPGGARVGAWETNTFAGFGDSFGASPGGPAYFELHTRDFDACLAFYRAVLGWDARQRDEVPGIRYATLEGTTVEDTGTAAGTAGATAGIMDATEHLAPGEASAWQVYFAVSDTDAAAADVLRSGGTLTHGPLDTPFGRQAGVTDPSGAAFRLLGPAPG